MTLFPFFEDIEQKSFVVIGGGKVAKGKVSRLLQFTDRITVISESTDIDLVPVVRKPFEESDVLTGDYIIGATDSKETNEKIFKACKKYSKPVNIVDDPEKCTFIFPSLIKRGDLVIGITSSGKSPALSRHLRKQIEAGLPDKIETVLDKMGILRIRLKDSGIKQETRSEILHRALDAYLENENADGTVENIISEYL